MTLLREIQLLLERTYAPVPINLEACVIGEGRRATLDRLAGEEVRHLAPSGRTFLRHQADSLYVAIFYAEPVIARLEADDPRQSLNHRNIAALITFIEEIAHGVQAALLFLEGERRIETEDFARNLEAQARVDTYLVLSKLAQVVSGGTISPRAGRWLRRQLFDQSHRHFSSRQLRERYGIAQKCALFFLRQLRHTSLPERQQMLREFRRLSWPAKLRFTGL